MGKPEAISLRGQSQDQVVNQLNELIKESEHIEVLVISFDDRTRLWNGIVLSYKEKNNLNNGGNDETRQKY